jgi:hypothetical protein
LSIKEKPVALVSVSRSKPPRKQTEDLKTKPPISSKRVKSVTRRGEKPEEEEKKCPKRALTKSYSDFLTPNKRK